MAEPESKTKGFTPDQAFQRVTVLEHRLIRWVSMAWVLSAALLVSVSGWWFTSRDNSDQREYDRKSECRDEALADILDQFRVLVIPSATPLQEANAEVTLDRLGSLEKAYRRCDGEGNGGSDEN